MGHIGSWEQRVVASLCASKRAGHTFDRAWGEAIKTHPPRPSALEGPTGGRLFEVVDGKAGPPEDCLADALCRFAWDAWHGRQPGLRQFTLDMFRSDTPEAIHDWRGEHRVAA